MTTNNLRYVSRRTVQDLWKFLQKKYRVKIKRKNKSLLMKTVAWILSRGGFMNKSDFMNNYLTTVKRTIYIPKDFEIGKGTDYDLIRHIRLAAHEFTHATQKIKLNYVTDPTKRAKYETDAFDAESQINHWLTGSCISHTAVKQSLIAYGITKTDSKYVESKIRVCNHLINQRIYRSEITRDIIDFLKN